MFVVCPYVLHAGKARCEVKNTILFVAFDFEEWTDECNDIACGSNRYVKNITSYLNKSGGTISGAIILETVLNHNSSAGMFSTFLENNTIPIFYRLISKNRPNKFMSHFAYLRGSDLTSEL